jgi:hypothetical protein
MMGTNLGATQTRTHDLVARIAVDSSVNLFICSIDQRKAIYEKTIENKGDVLIDYEQTHRESAMINRAVVVGVSLAMIIASPCIGQGLWDPQSPGSAMTDHLYNVDGTHRQAIWSDHAGFEMSVDGQATYDNWRSVDNAPQIRIDLTATSVDLRNEDFVVTARTNLRTGHGDKFHAGLCIVFSANDVMVWGPHGATDLRLRRPDGVDISQSYPNNAAFLKIKRIGNEYSAWYSADGKNWTRSGSTTISTAPIAVGTILKTWTVPHTETVAFDFLEITNVQNEPTSYRPNVRYGDTLPAPIFKYELSGVWILLRLFINDNGSAPDPEDTKYYLVHAATRSGSASCYSAILNYQWIVEKLENEAGHPNMVLVAPRFLREACAPHPYGPNSGYPDGPTWGYQNLQAEEDWILMDIHEDFTRTRFPAPTPGNDERFFLSGHSGGGQYVSRFIMGHSDKVIRAMASAPWGTAFPTGEYEWIYGTYLPSDFRANNPRFSVDLDGARALPLAVVMGEHDIVLDRSWEAVAVLSRRRLDNAMKWVRQMNSDSIDLYIVLCSTRAPIRTSRTWSNGTYSRSKFPRSSSTAFSSTVSRAMFGGSGSPTAVTRSADPGSVSRRISRWIRRPSPGSPAT